MNARDRILDRVRRAAAPAAPRPGPVRPQTGGDLTGAFIAKAEASGATVSRIRSLDDLPMAVAEELRNRNLPAAIRTGADPAFDRDWGTVERTIGAGRIEEPATLTRAVAAMAETGSLAFFSGPENPVTLNFLGQTHFAVIEADRIEAGYEELWAALRERGQDPRTINLITGPSRSGDIGQIIQMGAHGPVAVHVFVADGSQKG